MIFNKKMESYLSHINNSLLVNQVSDLMKIRILQGTNCNREPYFYLEHNCCNLNDNSKVKLIGEELTELEWNCNEIYINNSEDMICLVQTALLTVKQIKDILVSQYSSQSFDIVLSLDEGEDFEVSPSATIRFYAIRNDYYIPHDILNLEEFAQPILIDSTNEV